MMVVDSAPARAVPVTDPAGMPVLTVLLAPGKAAGDLGACRLMKVEAVYPGEWPWRRLTGVPADVPSRDCDLTGWRVQPVGDLALLLAHPVVLAGLEVR